MNALDAMAERAVRAGLEDLREGRLTVFLGRTIVERLAVEQHETETLDRFECTVRNAEVLLEAGPELLRELLGVGLRRDRQVGAVPGPGSEGEQAGVVDLSTVDEDPRTEGRADTHVSREVLHGRPQGERGVSERELVPDLNPQDDR